MGQIETQLCHHSLRDQQREPQKERMPKTHKSLQDKHMMIASLEAGHVQLQLHHRQGKQVMPQESTAPYGAPLH